MSKGNAIEVLLKTGGKTRKESEIMGETANATEKAPKKSWFKGLKSEFRKIIWPDKESIMKQSFAVIVITIILGAIIALLDAAIKAGINVII